MLILQFLCNAFIGNFAAGHIPVKQPSFESLPTTIKCEENETIFLPCLIKDLGESHIRWWKNETLLSDSGNPLVATPPKFTPMSDGMTIDNVTLEDDSEYTCEIARLGPWSSLKLVHKVQVLYPPLVFPSPPEGFLEVVLGEMVEIGCSSVGVPPPTITWRTKNVNIPVTGQKSSLLEFRATTPQMTGIYQCEASNGVGNPVYSNIMVNILHEPKVKAERRWVHSGPGVKTSLTCRVVANPEARVEWFFEGEPLKSFGSRVVQKIKGQDHLLLFDSVSSSDFGNYTCMATNRLGISKDSILLSGIANPAVFKQPQGKLPDTFILIWEVDSFSPIFEYKILLRKKEDTNWISFIIPADSSSSGPLHSKSYTLSGLERLPQYEAKIISRNRFGWSESSKVVTFGFTKSISAEDENTAEKSYSLAELALSSSKSCSKVSFILIFATTTLFLNICSIS